jgi:hypothetical protein
MTANAFRGRAALTAGERKFTLLFDVNAFCLLETAMGRPTDELVDDYDSGRRDLRLTRGLLWAGLQDKHPCTIAEAGVIMSDAGTEAVHTAVTSGMLAAFGVVSEGEEAAHPPMAADPSGTG